MNNVHPCRIFTSLMVPIQNTQGGSIMEGVGMNFHAKLGRPNSSTNLENWLFGGIRDRRQSSNNGRSTSDGP